MAQLAPFADLMKRPDVRIDLARACLLVAEDAYPGLEVEKYLAELERMAERLRGNLSQTAGTERKLVALNEFLFEELGYAGNAGDFYDPRNSYLNEVIDRRTGIPLTLSVVYMELGRRIGLPLQGVSFPGHFLVRLRLRGGMLVLDPFVGGALLAEDELRERLQRVVPESLAGGVPLTQLPLGRFLEPATNRQIVVRLLRNLKGVFRETDQPDRLLAVLNRMRVVAPEASAELRERGLLYQRLECHRAALADLTGYLEREPEAGDAAEIRIRIAELSRLCARLN